MKPPVRLLAMLRIKNEERWIGRCLSSISDVVDQIVILDDGSTDRTPEICRSFAKVARYEYLKNAKVDEVRDKNLLLAWTLELKPDWILALDGDEELGSRTRWVIPREISHMTPHNPEFAALSFRFVYFWNDTDTYRIDGKYAEVWHPRLFTTWNQDFSSLCFENHTDHCSGFHCGSVPKGIIGRTKKIGVTVKHYGYLDPELRVKKYYLYKANDPEAYARGYYEHLIAENARLEKWRGQVDEENLVRHISQYGALDRNPQGVHQMAAEMAGNSARVLDVGCGAGQVGALFKEKGCRVVGVESDPQAAALAREVLDEVIVGDAGSFHRGELVGAFDTVMLLDVLEHAAEPLLLLTNLRKYLGRDGSLIISVPNAAHWTIRNMILRGKFHYEDYGILDRTHLRFFTHESFIDLLEKAGLRVVEIRYALAVNSSHYMRWYLAPLRWLRLLQSLITRLGAKYPRLFAYQFLIRAVPRSRAA